MSSTTVIHSFQDRVRRAYAQNVQTQERTQTSSLPRLLNIVELLRLQQLAENAKVKPKSRPSTPARLLAKQKLEPAYSGTNRVFAKDYISPFDFSRPQRRLMRKYCSIWDDFFSDEVYICWREGRSWELCCYGEPGCGKSTLAAAIVADLEQVYDDGSAMVVPLFLDERTGQRFKIYQTPDLDPVSALRYNILRQINNFKSERGQTLRTTSSSEAEQNANVSVRTVLDQLDHEMQSLFLGKPEFQVFFIVDGLDRCPREITSAYLKEISRLGGRILTTREQPVEQGDHRYCDVEGCESGWVWIYYQCQGCGPNAGFDICWTCYKGGFKCHDHGAQFRESYERVGRSLSALCRDGISKYIQWEIQRELSSTPAGKEMIETRDFMEKLTDLVTKKAAGVLVIARIYMDYLVQKQSPNELLETLSHVFKPEALYFGKLMYRIDQQPTRDRTLALVSAQIISMAYAESTRQHITYSELVAALQFQVPTEAPIESVEELCRICQCIIAVSADDGSVIPFHEDLAIYLYEECSKSFLGLEVDMASLCLVSIRLALPHVNYSSAGVNGVKECFERDPFLAYALQSWGYHLRKKPTTEMLKKAIELLTDERDLNSYLLLACLSPNQATPAFNLWPGSTSLHVLAFFGLTDGLILLQGRIHTLKDVQDPVDGKTPLIVAIEQQNYDFVAQLLDLGADTGVLPKDQNSALYSAIGLEDSQVFDALMRYDAWRGIEHSFGRLMVRAAECQQPQILRQLISLSIAHIQKLDEEWHTVLIRCVQSTSEECITCVVQCPDMQWDRRNDEGENILHVAARSNLFVLSKVLTATPKDLQLSMINARVESSGKTVVMLATESLGDNYLEAVRLLVEAGADLKIADNVGRQLAHYAARLDDTGDFLDFLFQQKVNLECKDCNGWTPLHIACCFGSTEAVRKLLECGVKEDVEDCSGHTAPMVAELYGRLEELNATETLVCDPRMAQATDLDRPFWSLVCTKDDAVDIEVSEKPNKTLLATETYHGNTALHCAAGADHIEIVRLLLEDGRIDINAKNLDGHTALSLHCKRYEGPNPTMIEMLLSKGADCDLVIDPAKDPLQAAMEWESWDAALLIMDHRKTPPTADLDLQALLNEAIKGGRRSSIEKLLSLGANVLQHDRDGRLPAQTAEDCQDSDIRSMLENYQFATLTRLCPEVVQ